MTNAKFNAWIVYILAFGVFGIINTEMGVIGIMPQIAQKFGISASQAGLLVSLFALAVAIAGPVMPMLLSGINRKRLMLLVIGLFVISNIVSVYAPNFAILLVARIVPAFLHPVFFSVAFVAAANTVSKEKIAHVTAKVFMGVTAGMVIGTPISSFIADTVSLEASLWFFAIVNATTFIAISLFIPSMPVTEKLTYGAQLSVLKKPIVWISIATVIAINSAMYAMYSFFAEYLNAVTQMSGKQISLMLILFGLTGVIGNLLAGKSLSRKAIQTALVYPLALGAIYTLVFLFGSFSTPMIILIAIWGILFTLGLNISQYWITSAAPDAPEFANGLFVAFANLGVTVGTFIGGFFIAGMGTRYAVIAGLLFLALSLALIVLRASMYRPRHVKVGERTAA
ncbi:MFS transporter [Paenibacillus sacheonensis]|uniref:MFS transporter n=1 Tax=Paenibacillus sacheonensis TaxID=742054 RepID=A0A7X5BZ79_9BACL|nr:MFS transporter [Paenibacillus sacheonensis]MBM7565014.1 putative MFS family arabinose efflux permease [Paenibacillus sacheonensis]NBC70201.1 MFS transporter [Paenibacillus sacheonensis]